MSYELYVVTDEEISAGKSHEMIAGAAVRGGADVVQLRDKHKPTRILLETACRMQRICEAGRVLFIVNDRLDIALASGADGVHLGQDDLPVSVARAIAPRPFIIGVSINSAGAAVQAEQEGADYVVISPVFATGSKKDAGSGLGTGLIREVRARVSIPVLAIGGIGPGNVDRVISAGADGIAVISAVISSPVMEDAVRSLRSQVLALKKGRA